jgi:hypothetical protein
LSLEREDPVASNDNTKGGASAPSAGSGGTYGRPTIDQRAARILAACCTIRHAIDHYFSTLTDSNEDQDALATGLIAAVIEIERQADAIAGAGRAE